MLLYIINTYIHLSRIKNEMWSGEAKYMKIKKRKSYSSNVFVLPLP